MHILDNTNEGYRKGKPFLVNCAVIRLSPGEVCVCGGGGGGGGTHIFVHT